MSIPEDDRKNRKLNKPFQLEDGSWVVIINSSQLPADYFKKYKRAWSMGAYSHLYPWPLPQTIGEIQLTGGFTKEHTDLDRDLDLLVLVPLEAAGLDATSNELGEIAP